MNPDADRLRADLLSFYDRHRRDLPWRGEADPYRILVSEVMLQQTRVDTVREYYGSWLERFPDVQALAEASEDAVLKAWEGLGYYRRARNLHAAARRVRDAWGGELPRGSAELRSLPGVGEYTAGAVASIAFGAAVPAVDGNVRRVLARVFDVARPTPAWLRTTAQELVDPDRPGDWNQALMELGATVCTPRTPTCPSCPVAWACGARAAGTVAERPAPAERKRPRAAVIALAVLRAADGSVLLERRTDAALLGGMWALPEREVDTPTAAETVVRTLVGALWTSVGSARPRPLPHVRHRFTHIDATYVPWLVEVPSGSAAAVVGVPLLGSGGGRERRWVDGAARSALALPVAQRAVLADL